MCLGPPPQTLHYAKFWAQNATKTSAGNIPKSLSNLFLRDNCRLLQRLLNNAKSQFRRDIHRPMLKGRQPIQKSQPPKSKRGMHIHMRNCLYKLSLPLLLSKPAESSLKGFTQIVCEDWFYFLGRHLCRTNLLRKVFCSKTKRRTKNPKNAPKRP